VCELLKRNFVIAPIILCVCNLVVIAVPLVVVVVVVVGRYLQDWHHSAVVGSREVVEAGESNNQQTMIAPILAWVAATL